jgi:hypothetical protein
MENNTRYVQRSKRLHEGAAALGGRCVEMARIMIQRVSPELPLARGGRKAHELDTRAQISVSPISREASDKNP